MNRLSKTILIVAGVFLCIPTATVFASATDGTIDPAYHYAWSENAGWIDFGSSAGNVHITDSALTGSVYGENIGWIILNPQSQGGVTNNAEGTLSGYAWSENAGWIDFSKVTIGSNGVFAGNAYSENIGWITFGTGDNKVLTDWRPSSTRTTTPTPTPAPASSGGGGSSISNQVTNLLALGNTTMANDLMRQWPNLFPANASGAVSATPPPTVPSPGLSNTQITAILALLGSFGADASVIANVKVSLEGSGSIRTNSVTPLFTRDLKLGATGADVKQLQQFFNTHGFAVARTGAGSPGNETDYFGPATQKALIKFQTANGITPPAGYFGPKTRDYIKNLIP